MNAVTPHHQSWAGIVQGTQTQTQSLPLSVQTDHPNHMEVPFSIGNPDVEVLEGILIVENKFSCKLSSSISSGESNRKVRILILGFFVKSVHLEA